MVLVDSMLVGEHHVPCDAMRASSPRPTHTPTGSKIGTLSGTQASTVMFTPIHLIRHRTRVRLMRLPKPGHQEISGTETRPSMPVPWTSQPQNQVDGNVSALQGTLQTPEEPVRTPRSRWIYLVQKSVRTQ